MMVVYGWMHEKPRDEQGCRGLHSTSFHHELSLVEGHLLQQAQSIDHPVGHPGIMRISDEVIHSVHIDLTANYLAQAGSIDKAWIS